MIFIKLKFYRFEITRDQNFFPVGKGGARFVYSVHDQVWDWSDVKLAKMRRTLKIGPNWPKSIPLTLEISPKEGNPGSEPSE